MRIPILVFCVYSFFFFSCKEKEVKKLSSIENVKNTKDTIVRFEPENTGVFLLDSLSLGNDLVFIKEKFLKDDYSFKQIYETSEVYQVTNYRNKELIFDYKNSPCDSIVITKNLFSKYIGVDEVAEHILSGYYVEPNNDEEILNIVIRLCYPESDSCYNFNVSFNEKCKCKIERIDI